MKGDQIDREGWSVYLKYTAIADELIRLEVVDYITDTTVCNVMKKMRSKRGSLRNGAFQEQMRSL